jgi:hypothetical protein
VLIQVGGAPHGAVPQGDVCPQHVESQKSCGGSYREEVWKVFGDACHQDELGSLHWPASWRQIPLPTLASSWVQLMGDGRPFFAWQPQPQQEGEGEVVVLPMGQVALEAHSQLLEEPYRRAEGTSEALGAEDMLTLAKAYGYHELVDRQVGGCW